MRVFIGLALLSVAFATPLMPALTLPEPALPTVEGIVLPEPALPAYETPDFIQSEVDMQPALIPQSVADQLNDLKEIVEPHVDPVRFVDNTDDVQGDDEIAPAEHISPVKVVDHVDEAVPLDAVPLNEAEVDPVHFVDSPLEETEDRQAPEDPVEDVAEIEADPVTFVDNVEEALITKRDTLVLRAEPIDLLVGDVLNQEEIIADPVHVVDVAPAVLVNAEIVSVAHIPVVFVPYPERYYDNPLLR